MSQAPGRVTGIQAFRHLEPQPWRSSGAVEPVGNRKMAHSDSFKNAAAEFPCPHPRHRVRLSPCFTSATGSCRNARASYQPHRSTTTALTFPLTTASWSNHWLAPSPWQRYLQRLLSATPRPSSSSPPQSTSVSYHHQHLQANRPSLTLPSTGASIAQADQTSAEILDSLKNCPTRSYIIIEQAGVSSADYAGRHAAPALAQYMTGEHAGVKTTFAVSDVVGQVDASAVAKALKSTCGSDVPVHKIEAPVATSASRKLELQTAGM